MIFDSYFVSYYEKKKTTTTKKKLKQNISYVAIGQV